MNNHVKVIGRSLLSLVATLVIGGGVTYALFTSNQVSIAANTVSTGGADLRICDGTAAGGQWQDTVTTAISFAGLNPGAVDQDVMSGIAIYLGNDDGTLATPVVPVANCAAYNIAVTPGASTINMDFIPTTGNITCTAADPSFSSSLNIRYGFQVGAATPVWTGYKTVAAWASSTTDYSVGLTPGNTAQLLIQARLANTYSTQGASCTFDSRFVGEQA
ncbi:MAG: hypothetical protein AAB701_02095 [Patescibacteria group bacterium]